MGILPRQFLAIILALTLGSCAAGGTRSVSQTFSPSSKSQSEPTSIALDYFHARSYTATITENNTDMFYARKDGIYKYGKATKRIRKICACQNADELSVYEDNLYFTLDDETLSRLDLRTFKTTSVLNGKKYMASDGDGDLPQISDYQIVDGVVYIANAGGAVSYRLADGKLSPLSDESVEVSQIYQGKWYYIEHVEKTFTIYSADLKTGKTSIVLGEGRSYPKSNLYENFLWVGDALFYSKTEPDGIYRYQNGVSRNVGGGTADGFSAYQGEFYCISCGDSLTATLFCYDQKSGKMKRLNEISGYDSDMGYAIVDGWVYYNGGLTLEKQEDGSVQANSSHERPTSVLLGQ